MNTEFRNTGFMYEQGTENYHVVIYGAGRAGKDAYLAMNTCMSHIQVIAVLDDERKNIHSLQHLGDFVEPLCKIRELNFDYVVIAAQTEETWYKMADKVLHSCEIEKEKILIYLPPTPKQLILPRLETSSFLRERVYMLMERLLKEGDTCKEQVRNELKALSNIVKHEIIWLNYREWHADENKRCAYLQMPKVASTSLTKTIRKIPDGLFVSDVEGETRYYYRLPEDFDGFKFTFVRNPFARTVSCYRNKIEGKDIPKLRYYKVIGLEKDYGFEAYVKAIARIPDEWAERHFATQYFQAYEDGKCIVDYVGRFENLHEEYEEIRKKYGLEELEHKNASSAYDYRDYYTEELAELVYNRYKIDFETFGYEDEYERLLEYLRKRKSDGSLIR